MSKDKNPASQSPIDPFAEREAERYENPIASRECILDHLKEIGQPASYRQLVEHFGLEDDERCTALKRRLRAMERDGQLMCNRRNRYGLVEKMDLLRGRVIGHSDGFGFVQLDEGGDDLFLAPQQMRGILDGDRVLVRVSGKDFRGRREAVVVEVLERTILQIVGRFIVEDGASFVIPNNKRIAHDIVVVKDGEFGAKHGQIVVAELVSPENSRRQPLGRIIEILGDHMAPGMEVEIAIRSHNIPQDWPQDVEKEIAELSEHVSETDKANRIDLRDQPFVTIDGEDAKDFDDAVLCEAREEGGWKLFVAIADVSHYVRLDSALDQEARLRGNSVYFPGSVIPMLPEILSNGLCSLKPNVDRLAVVCEAHIGPEGDIEKYRFYRTVIRSQARLTYQFVAQVLEGHRTELHENLFPQLEELYRLYKVLHSRRGHRGAIDFDFPETKIIFDEERKIQKIEPQLRNDAHKLIEECMLVANVCAARCLIKNKLPGIFRNHAGPDPEKLEDLRVFLKEVGLKLKGGAEPAPKDYALLIEAVHGREDAHIIETVLLRSLSQACYEVENIGHFGLAFKAYTHFTSPIRRYTDLIVHRGITHIIEKRKSIDFAYTEETVQEVAQHCSLTERRADLATRDAVDWLKCEFMQDKLGKVFEGKIVSVTGFGIFVQLFDYYVEGLVHITGLKSDYYHFDAPRYCLKGEKTGKIYRIGDRLRVSVSRVDLEEKKIDFDLA